MNSHANERQSQCRCLPFSGNSPGGRNERVAKHPSATSAGERSPQRLRQGSREFRLVTPLNNTGTHLHPARSASRFLASIDMPTDLAFTNEQYEAQFAKELPAARPTRVESIQNVVVDVIKKTAAATSIYTSEFTGGAEETMQFACFLELDDEGKKITKMLEFVDTMTAARYQGLIEKWLKGK